jgi:hypothetical protein
MPTWHLFDQKNQIIYVAVYITKVSGVVVNTASQMVAVTLWLLNFIYGWCAAASMTSPLIWQSHHVPPKNSQKNFLTPLMRP